MVRSVLQDLSVQPDHKDLLVPKEFQDRKVLKELKVPKVLLDLLGLSGQPESASTSPGLGICRRNTTRMTW